MSAHPFRSWLKKLSETSWTGGKRSYRKRTSSAMPSDGAHKVHPMLEILEDRYVLSPYVTSTANPLTVGDATMTILGSGFDTNPANTGLQFNDGLTGSVTAATATSLAVNLDWPSGLSAGVSSSLYVYVIEYSIPWGTDGAVGSSPLSLATFVPDLGPGTANLQTSSTSITIPGTGFDTTTPNDSVSFSDSVTGSVVSATYTNLTVSLSGLSTLAIGTAIYATATVDGESSSNQEVAVVAPIVYSSTATLPVTASSLTIAGYDFDTTAAHDFVSFANAGVTGTVSNATTSSLTVALTGLDNVPGIRPVNHITSPAPPHGPA